MRNWTPAQLLAIQASGCDLLVSAAAGSGKTAVLTERLIRRLTDKENPTELSKMLIVTLHARQRQNSASASARLLMPLWKRSLKEKILSGKA